jgi:hypothetical protein
LAVRVFGTDAARWRTLGAVAYVGLVGAMAMLGGVTQDGHYYLAAVVLALPAGLAAFVAVYLGYGLLAGIGGLFVSTTTTDGDRAPWLTISSAALIDALFIAAAVGNLIVVPRLLRRKLRGQRAL